MFRKSSIAGLTAVVTGASGGIGLQFCRELARRGCDLVMVSNQDLELMECAEAIRKEYAVRTYPLAVDLTEPNVARAIDSWLDSHDIDPSILINNAGIFSFMPVIETSAEKMNSFINLHVGAVANLSRRFAHRFKRRGKGWILNMSSMSCWMPMPGIALYSSTKAFIRTFTRALHYEMRDYGVKVMVACPGGISTDLFGLPPNLMQLALKLHAVETPERFVKKALDAMQRGKKQYINGFINRLTILAVGMAPTPVRMLVKRRMLDKKIRR